MKILVVDDKEDARVMLCTVIDLLGYVVREAPTGRNALEIAAEFRPDVVISDIGLPDMTGYELVAPLRTRLPRDAVVIALSGYTQLNDRELGEMAGFDAMYAKPLDTDELADILAALAMRFEKSHSAAAA